MNKTKQIEKLEEAIILVCQAEGALEYYIFYHFPERSFSNPPTDEEKKEKVGLKSAIEAKQILRGLRRDLRGF